MTNKKYHTVGTVTTSNRKITERSKIDTCSIQVHDRSLPLLGTGASIKSYGVKLVLWTKTPPHSE